MNTRDDRDRTVDRLLRQSFQASGGSAAPGASCPDAETLGAWAEGSLSQSSLATVEAHLSECSRCQRIVAVLAKIPAPAPEARPWWRWSMDLRWLVPLAAGATAVALWVAVPDREGPQSLVPQRAPAQSPVGSQESAVGSQQSTVDSRQSAVDSRPSGETRPAAPPEGQVQARADERALKSEAADARPQEQRDARRETAGPNDALGRVAERASSAPPAAAPAPSTADAVAGARAEAFGVSRQANVFAQEVVSPTPLIRWRVGPRGLLEYTASGGAAWEAISSGVSADLVAGASPSASVCWIVGAGGTVLLAVDGRRFARIPFPVTVDLKAVAATDARSATVTASDGRTFRTTDAGSTWTP